MNGFGNHAKIVIDYRHRTATMWDVLGSVGINENEINFWELKFGRSLPEFEIDRTVEHNDLIIHLHKNKWSSELKIKVCGDGQIIWNTFHLRSLKPFDYLAIEIELMGEPRRLRNHHRHGVIPARYKKLIFF